MTGMAHMRRRHAWVYNSVIAVFVILQLTLPTASASPTANNKECSRIDPVFSILFTLGDARLLAYSSKEDSFLEISNGSGVQSCKLIEGEIVTGLIPVWPSVDHFIVQSSIGFPSKYTSLGRKIRICNVRLKCHMISISPHNIETSGVVNGQLFVLHRALRTDEDGRVEQESVVTYFPISSTEEN